MTEWKEYTGSDEQIKEMWNAADGYILRFSDKVNDRIRKAKEAWLTEHDFYNHCKKVKNVTNYLICNPHPLADMICQQARTGQSVWYNHKFIKASGECGSFHPAFCQPETYEYSFTEFKEEV